MPEPTPETKAATPKEPWYALLIELIEEIWAALPASQSEPNHPVAQKLAALKQSIPSK